MEALVGPRAAPVASVAVPAVELVCALALVAFPRQSFPGWIAFAVLLLFTVFLVRAAIRSVPCPCFGGATSTHPVGASAIVRNGVLLALAVLATG